MDSDEEFADVEMAGCPGVVENSSVEKDETIVDENIRDCSIIE